MRSPSKNSMRKSKRQRISRCDLSPCPSSRYETIATLAIGLDASLVCFSPPCLSCRKISLSSRVNRNNRPVNISLSTRMSFYFLATSSSSTRQARIRRRRTRTASESWPMSKARLRWREFCWTRANGFSLYQFDERPYATKRASISHINSNHHRPFLPSNNPLISAGTIRRDFREKERTFAACESSFRSSSTRHGFISLADLREYGTDFEHLNGKNTTDDWKNAENVRVQLSYR